MARIAQLVVLDATAVIAFRDPADPRHVASITAFREHQADELVMPGSAYSEVLVWPARQGPAAVASFEAFVADLAIRIEPVTREIARVAAQLRARHSQLNEQATEDAAKFGRVAVYKFAPGAADRVVARAREGFLPILKAQPGFVRYVIVKTGEDSGVSYTGWASKSQAEEAIDKAATWVKANLADLVGSVQNHVGEVLWSARR